jgi:hypothetical protein
MRWSAVLVAWAGVLAGTARADHKILVPRADSTVDWGTRKQVEGAVVELAKTVDRGVGRLDDGFGELAEAAGCKGDVDKCKGAVLEAVAVDELVLISITPSGDDHANLVVRRVTKGKTRDASAVVPRTDPEKAVGTAIGPLFGLSKSAGATKASTNTTRPAPPPPPPRKGDKAEVTVKPLARDDRSPPEPEPEPELEPAHVESHTAPAPAPVVAAVDPAESTVTAAPDNVVRDEPGGGGRRTLYIAGVATGGGLIALGALFWLGASSVQGDLEDAPDRTSEDVERILDLEAKGDTYALLGNICVIGGVAIAGTSAFLWWRSSRRSDAASARVVPAGFDGGGVGLGLAGGW